MARTVKRLLTGLEAIAWAAAEQGVRVVSVHGDRGFAALGEAARREGVRAERAPCDAAALDLAMRASAAGGRAVAAVRSLATLADRLHGSCVGGAGRGLVMLALDDPGRTFGGVKSDSRAAARALELPCLEPSDAGECKEFLAFALALSVRRETPVVMRLTARVASSGRPVHVGLAAEPGALDRVEVRSRGLGVVTSGASYLHVREALPEASVLKLGLVFPVCADLVRDFAARVERLVVVEEFEPVIASALHALGFACQGQDLLPRDRELGPDLLASALGGGARGAPVEAPARPVEACAGCPRRGVTSALKRLCVNFAGEPGCAEPIVALGGGKTVVVAASFAGATGANIDALAPSLGARRAREVDALDLARMEAVLREELARPEPSVVVARGDCPMAGGACAPPWAIRPERCNRCGACLRLGCPAIADRLEAMEIDASTCAGCGLCAQVCRAGAIEPLATVPLRAGAADVATGAGEAARATGRGLL